MLPVDTFDERFTTRLAARRRRANPSRRRRTRVAAAHLLTGYLTWTTGRGLSVPTRGAAAGAAETEAPGAAPSSFPSCSAS